MASDPLFGWDLTFKTVENLIKRKDDIIVAFIHWNLIKRGFRCIGIGDEKSVSGDEDKSELLPTGWNDSDRFALRYILDSKLYILHALNTGGNVIANLMKSQDLAVANIAVNVEETVKDMKGSVSQILPNYKELMYNVKRGLIDPVTEMATLSSQTQTSRPVSNTRDPLRVPSRPGLLSDPPGLWPIQPPRVPGVGRSDLDPFAPGGSGGMLYNPFAPRRDIENPGLGIPGGLPRGAVPPGARFDPFAPPGGPMPGARRPGPPDADHFPPPGFDDNMFL